MTETEQILKEIEILKLRNRKVETDKAWETSKTRKLTLSLLTYLIIGLTFVVINNPDPWKNALIPTIGYLLSTLTIPFFKDLWSKNINKK